MGQLRASIGSIELEGVVPRAKIIVDGRERTPPLRVAAGSHSVRVSADGYLPFEQRVDVVGGQSTRVQVTLAALTAAGRLSVSEQTGKALQVMVDNAAVEARRGRARSRPVSTPFSCAVKATSERSLSARTSPSIKS